MRPKPYPDEPRRWERFPTEWAMAAEQQIHEPMDLRIPAWTPEATNSAIGRPVERETSRPDWELDGAA